MSNASSTDEEVGQLVERLSSELTALGIYGYRDVIRRHVQAGMELQRQLETLGEQYAAIRKRSRLEGARAMREKCAAMAGAYSMNLAFDIRALNPEDV